MISGDTLIFTLMLITTLNFARYLSALRSLIFVMREAHPLLYQQVDGSGFFTAHGNVAKQVRLFHYLKEREYLNHHDDVFMNKCNKVRELFVLFIALIGVTLLASFLV